MKTFNGMVMPTSASILETHPTLCLEQNETKGSGIGQGSRITTETHGSGMGNETKCSGTANKTQGSGIKHGSGITNEIHGSGKENETQGSGMENEVHGSGMELTFKNKSDCSEIENETIDSEASGVTRENITGITIALSKPLPILLGDYVTLTCSLVSDNSFDRTYIWSLNGSFSQTPHQ